MLHFHKWIKVCIILCGESRRQEGVLVERKAGPQSSASFLHLQHLLLGRVTKPDEVHSGLMLRSWDLPWSI